MPGSISGPAIASLPPEIFAAILDTMDPEDLQASTLGLYRAFPLSGIPIRYLFHTITVRSPRQVLELWRALASEKASEDHAPYKERVCSFSFSGWFVDAYVLNNLLDLMPRIRVLHVNIGTTFSPEHLDDMFDRPRPSLNRLSLRFRPYFEKATYYQFLSGTYFDSMLYKLAGWPLFALKLLSIVQDPIPTNFTGPDGRTIGPSMAFAQPIVFFSIDPISTLAKSPVAQSVTHLRFRVPSRTIWHNLCVPSAFPSLEFLDVSTSLVNQDQAVISIINMFPLLEHLVIDGSGLCGNGREREGWRDIGRAVAMAGIKKAREKEREVKAMNDVQLLKIKRTTKKPEKEPPELIKKQPPSKPRGMGVSTISLRGTPQETLGAGGSAFTSASLAPLSEPSASALPILSSGLEARKFRLLAPPPRLLTLSAAASPKRELQVTVEQHREWIDAFEGGWKEGILRLREHWQRTRLFGNNSTVRILRFGEDSTLGADPLACLEDDDGMPELLEDDDWDAPPLLCFGCETDAIQLGVIESTPLSGHREGCGHAVGKGIWGA